MSLRTRLALVFIAATLIPLGATIWVTTALLDRSLRLSPVNQLSDLSRSLETTGQEYYRQACVQLKADALAGRIAPDTTNKVASDVIGDFHQSDEAERFMLGGDRGDWLLYLAKNSAGRGSVSAANPDPDGRPFAPVQRCARNRLFARPSAPRLLPYVGPARRRHLDGRAHARLVGRHALQPPHRKTHRRL